MVNFIDDLLIYLFFDGLAQVLLATAVAVTILPLASWIGGWNYLRLLGRFCLFNVLLLGWGGLGNAVWLSCTTHSFWVLDDAYVWASYLPPLPSVFDHAGGGQDAWGLLGHTTFSQLYLLWWLTAVPVWLLAVLSVWACARLRRPAFLFRHEEGRGEAV